MASIFDEEEAGDDGGLAKAEYTSLVAGGFSTASILAQLVRTIVGYRGQLGVEGLSSTFIILSLVGGILWLYWAVDLFIATDGKRGLFSIIYGVITIVALVTLLILRTRFFTRY